MCEPQSLTPELIKLGLGGIGQTADGSSMVYLSCNLDVCAYIWFSNSLTKNTTNSEKNTTFNLVQNVSKKYYNSHRI